MVEYDEASTPRLEVMDLDTGSRQDLGGKVGYCPRLSPDNGTVAVWEPSAESDPLVLLDVATGERRVAETGGTSCRGQQQLRATTSRGRRTAGCWRCPTATAPW